MNRYEYYRKRAGLRQVDVAAALNINQGTVASWEAGRSNPRVRLLPQLAKLFQCDVGDLLKEG